MSSRRNRRPSTPSKEVATASVPTFEDSMVQRTVVVGDLPLCDACDEPKERPSDACWNQRVQQKVQCVCGWCVACVSGGAVAALMFCLLPLL